MTEFSCGNVRASKSTTLIKAGGTANSLTICPDRCRTFGFIYALYKEGGSNVLADLISSGGADIHEVTCISGSSVVPAPFCGMHTLSLNANGQRALQYAVQTVT